MPPLRHITLSFRFALRGLRGGLKGFYVFLACIIIGVSAIAAVNSLADAMGEALARQGSVLLGADARFELNNREANPAEQDWLASWGTVSHITNLSSMARLADSSDQTLVSVKAVDGLWPLYGRFEANGGGALADLIASRPDGFGAVAAQSLLDRLSLHVGDKILIGNATLKITATVFNEPDAVSQGIAFAPRLLVSQEAIRASGLVTTGSLVRQEYKIRMPEPERRKEIVEAAKKALPEAGWTIRLSDRASPSLSDTIDRFGEFLTLVGLSALIVGGAGIANAVRAFLNGRRQDIAILKSVGAPASTVFLVFLFEIGLIALLGIAAGLVLGALTPLAAGAALSGLLPLDLGFHIYPGALALAAAFGIITTLAFTILPLGTTRQIPATALFRAQTITAERLPPWPYLAAVGLLLALLAALSLTIASDRKVALIFLAGTAATFVILRLVAVAIQAAARRIGPIHAPALRLAIGNIHRPGALTAPVVLALGLGLTLIVTLSQIDADLRRQITEDLPARAPNFFFVDIQSKDIEPFNKLLSDLAPEGRINQVPMLRGRIMALNGTDVANLTIPADAKWVLSGDRGITYAETRPDNANLTEGSWWPEHYTGEPLVSFAEEEGKTLGLKLGDTVTVNVLGRNLTAKIASFRKVNWQSMSINFVMVFSPNAFKGAPHAWLATLAAPSLGASGEAKVLKSVTSAYPAVTSVRVKDALEIVNGLLSQIGTAIRAASAITLLTSVLVLAGALAAGNEARTRDAVILKTLGASRGFIMRAFILEYAILGMIAAIFSLAAGSLAAFAITTRVMKLTAGFSPTIALATVAGALFVTIGIGLAGTYRILGEKAAPHLREE